MDEPLYQLKVVIQNGNSFDILGHRGAFAELVDSWGKGEVHDARIFIEGHTDTADRASCRLAIETAQITAMLLTHWV